MLLADYLADAESHYNPRVAVPGFETYIGLFRRLSEQARERLGGDLDLRYGPGELQTLDLFDAGIRPRPMLVYLHGGYWRALDKSQFSFVAEPLVDGGFPVALLNYDLCPAVTLDTVVAQALDGIEWVHRHADEMGGDGRLWLCGSSAGAHLAAMALGHDWSARGLGHDFLIGATLLTGIYDVEPVRHISVNQDVRLSEDMVRRNSPRLQPPRRPLPLLLAAGGAEPAGWIQQTKDYDQACRDAGVDAEVMLLAGENHFSINLAQADAGHPLTAWTLAHLRAAADG